MPEYDNHADRQQARAYAALCRFAGRTLAPEEIAGPLTELLTGVRLLADHMGCKFMLATALGYQLLSTDPRLVRDGATADELPLTAMPTTGPLAAATAAITAFEAAAPEKATNDPRSFSIALRDLFAALVTTADRLDADFEQCFLDSFAPRQP